MTTKLTVDKAALLWLDLKKQAKEIEKSIDDLKPILETALSKEKSKRMELHGWRFTLVEFVKENFSLSKAKEKIDGRILSPYITESKCRQIRTSWQGGEED